MEPRFLFPHRYKLMGWFIAIPSIILGLFVLFNNLSLDIFNIKVPLNFILYDGSVEIKGSIPKGTELNFTDEIATIGSLVV
jgi:hypothetical protein